MVTNDTFNKSKYKKPIIMPKNPARCHMPHDLAVADDAEAIERQVKLENYEDELKADTKVRLQEKSDDMVNTKRIEQAKKEMADLKNKEEKTLDDRKRIGELEEMIESLENPKAKEPEKEEVEKEEPKAQEPPMKNNTETADNLAKARKKTAKKTVFNK